MHRGFVGPCFMRPEGWAHLSGEWSFLVVIGILHPLMALRLGRALDPQDIVFFPEPPCFLKQNLHLLFVFSLAFFHVVSPLEVTFVTSCGRMTPRGLSHLYSWKV